MTDEKNENDMKKCDIKMGDGRILRFNGKLLAEIDDSRAVDIMGKEIEQTFWEKYKLYISEGAKFMIYYASFMRSSIQKEGYKVFSNEQELVDYAVKKDKRLLFKLLKRAKIPIIIEVDYLDLEELY